MSRQVSLLLAVVLVVSACSWMPGREQAPLYLGGEGIYRLQGLPENSNGANSDSYQQRVDISLGSRQQQFALLLEITGQRATVVGLDALGQILFSASYEQRWRFQKPQDMLLSGEQLLAYLRLACWPQSQVLAGLDNVQLQLVTGQAGAGSSRIFMTAGPGPMLSVEYPAVKQAPSQQGSFQQSSPQQGGLICKNGFMLSSARAQLSIKATAIGVQ